MPQVTLTFNLPDDESEYDDARLGGKLRCAMNEFYNESLRRRLKHCQLNKSEYKLLEAVRTEFFECLKAYEAGDV